MEHKLQPRLKKKTYRERFYSSMNHQEYTEIYGPPPPLFKPQQDPMEDIPLLDLELPETKDTENMQVELQAFPLKKMETIFQIDGSQNCTQNLQRSPKFDFFMGHKNRLQNLTGVNETQLPARTRVRMRTQSDNSEYLIFNFLQRATQTGRKKIKTDL